MFTRIWSHLRGWLAGFNAYHNTYRRLNRLSDKDLADIGLHRCDVDRIAYEYKREKMDEYLRHA